MKRRMGVAVAVVGLSALTSNASGRGSDPCDFASSGAAAFSYEQVMACYRSVPFSPDDLHNIVQVVRQHRSFSDLSEIYDERVGWKQALRALDAPSRLNDYPSDLAMHDALKREHKQFRDAHVSYTPPDCYWRMLNAFVPLEFGSTILGQSGEQVVFVEGAPILPDVYQASTGIDPRTLVGLRVLSINGVPVLDYFRAYSELQKTHEDAGGGLNGVLAGFEYSFRLGAAGDFVPDRAVDTYVFESRRGERRTVRLPWVFALSGQILGDLALPPSGGSREFIKLCQQGPSEPETSTPEAGVADTFAALDSLWGLRSGDAVERHRQRVIRRLRAIRRWRPTPEGYFEVPEQRMGQDVEEIIPFTDSARVVQYLQHVTAIQLADTVSWTDVARQGVEYACEHSDRLILDVRNNGGGNDTVIRWLHHYLLPDAGSLVSAGLLPVRLRNDNRTFNEVLFNFALFAEGYLQPLGADPCTLLLTPGCLLDVNTGAPLPLSEVDWFFSPKRHENRGGERVSLSRQVGLPNVNSPEFDTASCAGRFTGESLVILTNGSNASGGYFLPAAFKGEGIIVNTGGYAGEPMAMGRARGGATLPGSIWSAAAQAIEAYSEGQIRFRHRLVGFQRPVETQMEMLGAYRKDRKTLHINDPVEADLQVNVWANQLGSEGFVYQRVLRAVDAR